LEKDFANASAATPPAVYFAKSFSDYPALRFIWQLIFDLLRKFIVSN